MEDKIREAVGLLASNHLTRADGFRSVTDGVFSKH